MNRRFCLAVSNVALYHLVGSPHCSLEALVRYNIWSVGVGATIPGYSKILFNNASDFGN